MFGFLKPKVNLEGVITNAILFLVAGFTGTMAITQRQRADRNGSKVEELIEKNHELTRQVHLMRDQLESESIEKMSHRQVAAVLAAKLIELERRSEVENLTQRILSTNSYAKQAKRTGDGDADSDNA